MKTRKADWDQNPADYARSFREIMMDKNCINIDEYHFYKPVDDNTDEDLRMRTAAIERTLIKKFRKPLWSRFTKAVRDYRLIQYRFPRTQKMKQNIGYLLSQSGFALLVT